MNMDNLPILSGFSVTKPSPVILDATLPTPLTNLPTEVNHKIHPFFLHLANNQSNINQLQPHFHSSSPLQDFSKLKIQNNSTSTRFNTFPPRWRTMSYQLNPGGKMKRIHNQWSSQRY